VEQQRTPGDSKQHKFDTRVVFWHDAGPVVEHPEASKEDLWKRFILSVWLKNGVAKATPIKVEKSRELNIGSMLAMVRMRRPLSAFCVAGKNCQLLYKIKDLPDLGQMNECHKLTIKARCDVVLRPENSAVAEFLDRVNACPLARESSVTILQASKCIR